MYTTELSLFPDTKTKAVSISSYISASSWSPSDFTFSTKTKSTSHQCDVTSVFPKMPLTAEMTENVQLFNSTVVSTRAEFCVRLHISDLPKTRLMSSLFIRAAYGMVTGAVPLASFVTSHNDLTPWVSSKDEGGSFSPRSSVSPVEPGTVWCRWCLLE